MSMSDIKLWLQSLGLEKYGEVLTSHDVDLSVAPDLTEQDLEKLGFSLGHRACSPALSWLRRSPARLATRKLLDELSTPEAGVFVPELWRIRGELVLRSSAGNSAEAERYFETAVRIAENQGATVYRLRAAILLARLLGEGGRRHEAKMALDRAISERLDEWNGPELAIAAQLQSDLRKVTIPTG
jgi:hypothetical protein